MATKKHSIYLTPEAERAVGSQKNESGRINLMLERYGRLVREGAPPLSLPQWRALVEGLAGFASVRVEMAQVAWARLADLEGEREFALRHPVDLRRLSDWLRREARFLELCAVLDVAYLCGGDADLVPQVLAELGIAVEPGGGGG